MSLLPTWHGIQINKHPNDLWAMQEILFRTRPSLVIECGTGYGGSAFYFAHLMDLMDYGRVITVDHQPLHCPYHSRITYLRGDTTDSRPFDRQARIMVILDSDHSAEHVTRELTIYAPLVSPECYVIVEDTDHAGPQEAVEKFLPDHPEFEIDRTCERFGFTHNPGGYLRRRHE